jgi:hypothetical protein
MVKAWVGVARNGQLPDPADAPRHLTDEEIRAVSSNVPQGYSADPVTAATIRKGLMDAVEWSLRRAMLCPSTVPMFTALMVEFYHHSLIHPGTAVAMAATEAIAAILTQATLNTFHFSGAVQSIGGSVSGIRDIIQATANPKNPVCLIHFMDKFRSFAEVLSERARITGNSIHSCLNLDPYENYRLAPVVDIPRLWWETVAWETQHREYRTMLYRPTMQLRLQFNPTLLYKQRITLAMIAKILQNEWPNPSVTVIYGPTNEGILDVYSTANISYDINKQFDMNINADEVPAFEELFLQAIVLPELERLVVKGISGLGELTPVKMPVWSMVMYEEELTHEILSENSNEYYGPLVGHGGWLLYLNQANLRKTGLTPQHVADLCVLADMKVHKIHQKYLVIQVPEEIIQLKDSTLVTQINGRLYEGANIERFDDRTEVAIGPYQRTVAGITWTSHGRTIISNPEELNLRNNEYYRVVETVNYHSKILIPLLPGITGKPIIPANLLNNRLTADKERHDQLVATRNMEVNVQAELLTDPAAKRYLIQMPVQVAPSELRRRSQYICAIVQGDNLGPLLALSGVDRRRTTCTNMHVLRKIFGNENARTYIVRAIHNIIASIGKYIHPTHINIIADLMCSRGTPMGMSFSAVGRLNSGHITGSSIAKAGKVLTTSAIHGAEEKVTNTSAAISMGTLINIGTGYTDVIQRVTIDGAPVTLINAEIAARFKDTDEEKVRNLQNPYNVSTGGVTEDDFSALLDVHAHNFDFGDEEEDANPNSVLYSLEKTGEVQADITPIQVYPTEPIPGSSGAFVIDSIGGNGELPDLPVATLNRLLVGRNAQTTAALQVPARDDPTGLFNLGFQ